MLTWVQTRWLRLGLFPSICPTIKYQPGKAKVVANALSQSQRNEIEDSMYDPEATAATVEEQVSCNCGALVCCPLPFPQISCRLDDKAYPVARFSSEGGPLFGQTIDLSVSAIGVHLLMLHTYIAHSTHRATMHTKNVYYT